MSLPEFFGLDGCTAGWWAVWTTPEGALEGTLFGTIGDFWNQFGPVARCVLIDIPIGLPHSEMPRREADHMARRHMGKGLASRVFPVPCREALGLSYPMANSANRTVLGKGLSRQTWNISPKIAEVDELLRREPSAQCRFHEGHPELAWMRWNKGLPVSESKKSPEGQRKRRSLLRNTFPDLESTLLNWNRQFRRKDVGIDDQLDAGVLLALAKLPIDRWNRLPQQPPLDTAGLPMQIVF